jgi:hypothetical protein
MLIGTLNQAIGTIRTMKREEINTLTTGIEDEGCWVCRDRRKKRDFCIRYIISMWDADRCGMIRLIYNAQEN